MVKLIKRIFNVGAIPADACYKVPSAQAYEIEQEIFFAMGYSWDYPEWACNGEDNIFHMDPWKVGTFSEDVLGYFLNPHSMTFIACDNKYMWENPSCPIIEVKRC